MTNNNDTDVYRNLQKHLDDLPIGFPKTDSGSDIRVLKAFFSPEDAELACFLPFSPKSAENIFLRVQKKLSITLEEVKKRLLSMADRGLIFSGKQSNSDEKKYMIAPLAVGFFEYSVDNVNKEKAEAVEHYMQEAFIKEFSASKIPQMRTIPIETSITPDHPIIAYDDVWRIVEQMNPPYVISPCVCVQEKQALGKSSRHTLTNRCITNSRWYLEHGHGKEVSKDEIISLIKQAEADGLVLQPGSYQKGTYLCLCCNCCCGILSNMKKLPQPAKDVWTNHYSVVDQTLCKECGACISKCPMAAISLHSKASVNLDRCIGCGVCVPSCPENAIRLMQKSEVKEPPETIIKLYTQMWKNRLLFSPFKRKFSILKEILKIR